MSHATLPLPARLQDFVSAGRVLTDAASLTRYEVDGRRPSVALLPDSAAEIAEILRFAYAERIAVIPVGGKTRLHIGMPPDRYDLAIDVSNMKRILAYEPRDLTLAVEPGMTFSDLDRRLQENRQFLPLCPVDAERTTIGGLVASAADGPLRYAHGTSKDFLLGLEFLTGEGILSKSGGSVVKNVTGYELHKLFIGSLGTLGIITRLNFRTFPLPPGQQMFVAAFDQHSDAVTFCRNVVKSPLQPRILDLINPAAAGLFADHGANFLNRRCWLVMVEAVGQEPVLERHAQDLASISRDLRAREFLTLGKPERDQLFTCLCQFPGSAFGTTSAAMVFRIAALPSSLTGIVDGLHQITDRHELACAILIRAHRIVYLVLLSENHKSLYPKLVSCSRELTDLCVRSRAAAMIERCPREIKRALNIWPAPGSELEITQQLKRVFDPQSILSPGRFRGGL